MALFTFGHSTLEAEQALDLLQSHNIDLLVDVRSHPTSHMNHWRKAWIKKWLQDTGIQYKWMSGLGGWAEKHVTEERVEFFANYDVDLEPYTHGVFPKQRIARPSGQPGWTNMGFWDYQFFMTLPEFMNACDRLIALDKNQNVAFMCAEAKWWNCHRSMIADYLLWLGLDSYHIQARRKHSDVVGDRLDRYHPYVQARWRGEYMPV